MGDVAGLATAASLAVVILFVSCCCRSGEGACPDVERRALLDLKHSINYPNGTALPNWGGHAGDGDCCRWPGITCDDSVGGVVGVDVSNQRTSEQGTWDPSLNMLVHLRNLQSLDLSSNHIGGWAFAQAFCELKHLRVLYLRVNSLNGIPPKEFYVCLCQMSSLARLSLGYNEIQGTFPPCLCNMSSLKILGVSRNRLQGNIPPCLGNLYSLEYLSLWDNEFVGSIPPSIFHNLTNLREMWIGNNWLEGTLELSVLANLSKLASLYLMSGPGLEIETESSSWIPTFQLQIMNIYGCTINRRSNYRVPSFISTQNRLKYLLLSRCSLTGRLPSWLFCNSSLQGLFLGGNQFDDMFPQPCHNSSSAIEILEFAGNRIHGSLPNRVGFQFPKLKFLEMRENELEAQVPPSLGRSSLQFLGLSNNNLFGELQLDLTRNATKLEWLDLSYNQMEGEMLPRDSHLPNLKFLYLRGNNFTGPISPSISNSSLLEVLDIGGNNLRCDLSRCLPVLGASIRGLLLEGNFFEGNLPRQLCRMPYLQFLDISMNSLSGEILPCFNNISSWKSSMDQGLPQISLEAGRVKFQIWVPFTSKHSLRVYAGGPLTLMTGLDLSFNKFEGNIPPELGGLKQLQTLNLSYNHLRGSIPASFSDLLNMESLDLSHNNLNGTIPPELSRLNFLSAFSVAFNDLSGEIPSGGQLFSFNKSSYEGNAELCGPPLDRNCSNKGIEPPGEVVPREDEEEYGVLDNDTLFYSFLALSYALGHSCIFAILLLNKRWRVRFLRAVDKYYALYLRRFVST